MTLKELHEQIAERRKELSAIFQEAKTDEGLDFRRVKSVVPHKDMSADDRAIAVADRVDALNKELAELTDKYERLARAERALESANEPAGKLPVPAGADDGEARKMGWGDIAVRAAAQIARHQGTGPLTIVEEDFDPRIILQAVVSTTSGLPPFPEQLSTIVPLPIRPLTVLDAVPAGRMTSNSLTYRQQVTRTPGATEIAEGGAFPASTLTWQQVTAAAAKIGDSIQVTDEQLEDEPQIADLIEQQLGEHVRQRLDSQILNGDGTAPNLRGILNTTGILTRAQGSDDPLDAIHKAMVDIQTGSQFASPTLVVMNPADWSATRLKKSADGVYILGQPSDQIVPRVWGLPVATSLALSAGTVLIGSFTPASIMFHVRRGVTIQTGFVNDDFGKGLRTVRADMRGALAIYRTAAFATVTGYTVA